MSGNAAVLACGNFALTVVLLQKFAEAAARLIPQWEIIDYAHDDKVDAPSGTARELAARLAKVRAPEPTVPVDDTVGPREARGATLSGSQVHSIRLPGYVISAEVIFGMPDQKLTIRHDAGSSARPYVDGALLAIRQGLDARRRPPRPGFGARPVIHHSRRSISVPNVRTVRCVLAMVLALAAACRGERSDDGDAYQNVMAFDSARVRLARQSDTLPVRVQLAISPEQKSMGLMERRRLADDAGMIFVYDSTQPPDAGFWMYRTRIPLDIAFLDSAGVIRSIRSMVPCPTTIAQGCPTYTPDVPYQYALEVNAGFFGRHGIQVGHKLLLRDLPPPAAPKRSARILPRTRLEHSIDRDHRRRSA